MNQRSHRSTSFKRLFTNQKALSNVPNSGAFTIPRESTATFYPKFSYDSSMGHEGCIMKGWLKRQNIGLMKINWQNRWFVLIGDYLRYYSSEDQLKSHLGMIYLPGHSLIEHPLGNQQKFIFELQSEKDRAPSRSHLFCAESEEERKEWVKHIKEVLYGRKGGAIFGRPLELAVKYDRMRNKTLKVPEFVKLCVEFLQENGLESEGLFRLPGRAALVRQLRNAFDIGERPQLDQSAVDVHSVASLLKSYLRELPSPIIPIKFYDPVMHIITREIDLYPEESIDKLAKVISTLPLPYFNLLHYLCRFLYKVGQRSEVNRMTEMNLATVFSQSFIRPEDDDPALLMGTSDNRSKAVFVLISQVDRIFAGRSDDHDDGLEDKEVETKDSPLDFNNKHFEDDFSGKNDHVSECFARTKLRNISNSEDWTPVDKIFVDEDDDDEDLALPFSMDQISREKLLRRSMSLGDEPLMTSDGLGMVGGIGSSDSGDLDSLLASDPSILTESEMVERFLRMRDELLRQRMMFSELKKELSDMKRMHVTNLRMMANRLNEERTATSEAVRRVVEIQATLEKYHLKYGPL